MRQSATSKLTCPVTDLSSASGLRRRFVQQAESGQPLGENLERDPQVLPREAPNTGLLDRPLKQARILAVVRCPGMAQTCADSVMLRC